MANSVSRALCLILAITTGISIAQKPPTSLWPVDACTDKSLSIPSWVISEFSSSDVVSFTLTNRVTELSSSISCQDNGKCTGGSNDDLEVTINVSENIIEVTVQDAWTCRDKKTRNGEPKIINFKGKGNVTVSLDCKSQDDTQICSSVQDAYLVKGALTEPVQSEMLAPAADPIYSNTPTCQALAAPPLWEVKGIDYYNNTVGNMWAGPQEGRGIGMDIVNNASGDVVQCRVYFTTSAFDPVTRRDGKCWRSAYDSSHDPPGPGQIWTEFTFDEVTHDFSLKQRWYCEEPKTMKSFAVNGTVTARLPLNCTTVEYGVRGDRRDLRTNCDNGSVPLTGKVVSREELPPFAIRDPYPTTDVCPVGSLVAPYFKIGEGKLNITSGSTSGEGIAKENVSRATISFNLNTTENYRFNVERQIDISDTPGAPEAMVWYKCMDVNRNYGVSKCEFRYDYGANKLEIHEDWQCVYRPEIMFNATGSASPQRKCSQSEDGQICTFDPVTIDPEILVFH